MPKVLLLLVMLWPAILSAQKVYKFEPGPFAFDPLHLVFSWTGKIVDRATGKELECKPCVIDFKRRIMTKDGESRLFAEEEAVRVSQAFMELHKVFVRYGVESLIWWQEGRGLKLKPAETLLLGQESLPHPQPRVVAKK